MKIIFWSGTKSLGTAQYLNKFWSYTIKFGPAQTILGPVEGQGIRLLFALGFVEPRLKW